MKSLIQELSERLESGMPLVEEWTPAMNYGQVVAASKARYHRESPEPVACREILEAIPAIELAVEAKRKADADAPKQRSLLDF